MLCIVGHRGAAGVLPENTLKGFRYAIELGVDAVECDVHLSRDGQLVVMHDERLDRTTNGCGRIAATDLAEIRHLDAGDGEKVPTLDEVLETVAGKCALFCELKADGTETAAVERVLARGMEQEVLFISFDLDRLARIKQRQSNLRVGAVSGFVGAGDMDRLVGLGVEHVGVQFRSVSMATVERAREAGVELGVWTPNKLSEMKAMMALGIDCITTDRPDILVDYRNRQGKR